MTYTYRPVITIDIEDKNFDKIAITNPEFVVLTCKTRTLDVGSLCYKRRGKSAAFKPHGKVLGATVDKSSLIIERRNSVTLIIEHLIDFVRLGGSTSTAEGHYKIIVAFYKFCNSLEGNAHDIINKKTVCLYTSDLRKKSNNGNISLLTASERQSIVCRLYASYNNISRDLVYGSDNPLIKSKSKQQKKTTPVDDARLAQTMSFCRAVFDGAVKALDAEKLPFFFETIEGKAAFSPQIPSLYFENNKESFSQAALLSLNFDEGRLNENADMPYIAHKVLSEKQCKKPAKYLHRFKHASINSKEDSRSLAHLEMANIAVSCFFNMFIASTGLNLTTALSLRWSDNYLFKEKSQGIREVVVKPRANYNETPFSITAVFKPLLLKYLALRKYILNGRDSDYLFVVFAGKPRPCFDKPEKLIESRYTALRDTIVRRSGVDYIPTARELRATRSDFNIRKHGVFTAAELNGNSIETTLKHYSAGSQNRAASALSPFYSKVREAAYALVKNTERTTVNISDESTSPGDIDIKTGHCSSFNEPELSIEFNDNAAKPSCEKSVHGCLFCKNYRIHASKKDLRKLFSMLECVYLIKSKARSLEHFEESWGAVIMRVNDIVDAILNKHPESSEMISKIQTEVSGEGELDPYWLSHYNMMRELTA